MFKKIKQQKSFLLKFISVFICVTLIIGIAPISVFSDLWVSAAEEPNYGTYTVSADGKTLTAVPNEGAAFRGWYKGGTEVSYEKSYTLKSGEKVSDLTPEFYNFNMVKDSGFEKENADGEWKGVGFSISTAERRNGVNSLKISSTDGSAYAYGSFSDLEAETQYTISYYYKGYSLSGFVIGGDSVLSSDFDNNTYNGKYLAKNNGAQASSWKKGELTFYTKDNTTVSLLLNSTGNSTVYIDDVCLVKDVMAAPTYFNEDFSNGFKNVYVYENPKLGGPNYKLSIDNGRLKVEQALTFGVVQFLPIKLKKGAKYTITFNLDMSNELLNETNVPELNSDGNGYLYENNYIKYATYPNWINFSLTETQGRLGSKNNYDEWIIGPEHATSGGNLFTATISDGVKTVTKRYTDGTDRSAIGFPKSFLTDQKLNVSNLKVTMKVTAVKNCVAYLSACLNGRGTFYIDNLNITEESKSVDVIDIISNSDIKTLGTAIRTVGTQGIRHKTQIDKRLLTSDNGYGIRVIEYGTVAIRTAILAGEELVIDKKDYYYQNNCYQSAKGVAYSFKDKKDLVYNDEQTTIDFTGVLINIPFERWNSDYTARAYFKYVDKNGVEGIFYFETYSMAVYPISKEAYSKVDDNGEFMETDEVRDYLYKNILTKFNDKTIKISDAKPPVYSNFQGIRSTVYHAVTFFPDSHKRTYTESQAAVEMDRLVDSKVDNVRTRLASQWMWDGTGWNWESDKMQAFYKWARMLKERDISITINAGWHLHDFIFFYDTKIATEDKKGYEAAYGDKDGNGHSSIPEVNYLHGYTDAGVKIAAKYGEDSNASIIKELGKAAGLELTDNEYDHYSLVAARYAEWIKQSLKNLKANGADVEYVMPFTETGYQMVLGRDENNKKIYDTTFSYDEYALMAIALDYTLSKEGTRSLYKFIGPSQSIYTSNNRLSLVEYLYGTTDKTYGNYSGVFTTLKNSGKYNNTILDINSMHIYATPDTNAYPNGNSIFNPYACYYKANDNFTYYNTVLKNTGTRNTEFWCDEYFASAPDSRCFQNVGMQMTQFAAGLTAGINNGINRFSTWQMFDTLWDGNATHGDCINTGLSEFAGGIHVCGTCPSLVHVDGKTCPKGPDCPCTKNYSISSYVPRTTYYGINLIGKYMNNENAGVFATQVSNVDGDEEGGVYVSAIKNDNDKIVILVVNTMSTTSSVNVEFEREYMASFTRYTYDPNEVVPTAQAKSLSSDKTITMYGENSFCDIIPAQSFSIYVEGT